MFVKVWGKHDNYWREYVINTKNIVRIWFAEMYCIDFNDDDPGLWIDKQSYDKLVEAMKKDSGIYNNEDVTNLRFQRC